MRDVRGHLEVTYQSINYIFFCTPTSRKGFLTFYAFSICTFLCLNGAMTLNSLGFLLDPMNPTGNVTAVQKLLIKCFADRCIPGILIYTLPSSSTVLTGIHISFYGNRFQCGESLYMKAFQRRVFPLSPATEHFRFSPYLQ